MWFGMLFRFLYSLFFESVCCISFGIPLCIWVLHMILLLGGLHVSIPNRALLIWTGHWSALYTCQLCAEIEALVYNFIPRYCVLFTCHSSLLLRNRLKFSLSLRFFQVISKTFNFWSLNLILFFLPQSAIFCNSVGKVFSFQDVSAFGYNLLRDRRQMQ